MKKQIAINDVKLPTNYNFQEASLAWDHTCKVCDASDTYDLTYVSTLADFNRGNNCRICTDTGPGSGGGIEGGNCRLCLDVGTPGGSDNA